MMPKLSKHRNSDLLSVIRNEAGLEYRSRIPKDQQTNAEYVLKQMSRYPGVYNDLLAVLVNKIGLQWVNQFTWKNPLADFKRESMEYGSTIEEIQLGLLKAKGYDANEEHADAEIWGREMPDMAAYYHSVNRQVRYKISVDHGEVRKAFLSEFGLNKLVDQWLTTPATSDNLDEFHQMMRLFSMIHKETPFYTMSIPDMSVEKPDAQGAMRKIRGVADLLPYISTEYNAARMPVATDPEDMVLLASADLKSAMDVYGMAALFNSDYADINKRVIVVPDKLFNIAGVQGILTSKNFFVAVDTLQEMRNIENPSGLYTNYFYHHWGIVSGSRFAPVILLTGGKQTAEPVTKVTNLANIVLEDPWGSKVTAVKPGGMYAVSVTETPDNNTDSVHYSVTGNNHPATKVTASRILTVSPAEGTGHRITVSATSLNDPSKTTASVFPVNG